MPHRPALRHALPLLLAALLLAPAARGDEAGTTPAQALIEKHAASVVSLRFVLTTRLDFMGQSQEEESNVEARGVVIGEDGLVLTAASHFEGGLGGRVLRLMGSEIDMETSVADLRVLFGTESKEYDAQIVAKDTNLGVAFVQVLDLEDRKPQALALEGAREEAAIGRELLGLSRLARGFDCAPMVGRLYVAARVERPRKMWAVHGNFDGVGMPVFEEGGALLGFLSMQEGAEGAESGGGGGMLGMLGGGAAERLGMFVLPAGAVRAQLGAVRERAARLREEAAKARAEREAAAPETPEEAPAR